MRDPNSKTEAPSVTIYTNYISHYVLLVVQKRKVHCMYCIVVYFLGMMLIWAVFCLQTKKNKKCCQNSDSRRSCKLPPKL